MNYEKAYKDALERAKNMIDDLRKGEDILAVSELEAMFPELRESEDERIRTRFIEYFQGFLEGNEDCYKDGGYVRWEGLDVKSILAWLEKQKEQKPWKVGANAYFTPEQKPAEKPSMLKMLKEHLANTPREQLNAEFEALRDLTIDKPAEWSDDYREEDIQTRFAFYTYKDEDGVLYLSNVFVEETSRNHGFGTRILRAAEKVAETIGATTISLKVKQDSPANAWYRKNGYGYVAFEDGYDWLEKNLEYMKPNKPEWSEEDEAMRDNILRVLSCYVGPVECESNPYLSSSYFTYRREIGWLKSLRPRPHWKPTEEQMKALNYAIAEWDGGKRLESLYALRNDLKKL